MSAMRTRFILGPTWKLQWRCVLVASVLVISTVIFFFSSSVFHADQMLEGRAAVSLGFFNSFKSRMSLRPQLHQETDGSLPSGSANRKPAGVKNDSAIRTLPVFYSDVHPDPLMFNLYLMETSSTDKMPPRVLCAIESFCATNPNGVVWFLTTARLLHQSTLDDLESLRSVHKNLHVAFLDFELLLMATPLLALYKSKKFWNTPYLPHHLSDIGRLAVVYKSGGLYSDLDIIALKTTPSLHNFLVVYDQDQISNAMFRLEPGHPMLLQVMVYVVENYDGKRWGHNGPNAITTVVKKFGCVTRKSMKNRTPIPACSGLSENAVPPAGAEQGSAQERSSGALAAAATPQPSRPNGTAVCDWQAFTPSSFYPNLWNHSKDLFKNSRDGNDSKSIFDIFPYSCGVHLSNKITEKNKIEEGSIVHKLSLKACPIIVSRHPLL